VRLFRSPVSKYFYWDDIPGRRLRPEVKTDSEEALRLAKAYARAMRDAQK
jgi:hypothetical protein